MEPVLDTERDRAVESTAVGSDLVDGHIPLLGFLRSAQSSMAGLGGSACGVVVSLASSSVSDLTNMDDGVRESVEGSDMFVDTSGFAGSSASDCSVFQDGIAIALSE